MKKINKTVGGRDYCFADCIYEMCKYHQNQGLCNTPQNLEESEKCDKYKGFNHWWEENEEYIYLMVEDLDNRGIIEDPIVSINKKTNESILSDIIYNPCCIHEYVFCDKHSSIDELKREVERRVRYDIASQMEVLSHVLMCMNRGSDISLG